MREWRKHYESLAAPQRWDALLLFSQREERERRFKEGIAPHEQPPRLPAILPDDRTLSTLSAREIVACLDAYTGMNQPGPTRKWRRSVYRDKGSLIRKNAQTLCRLGVSRFRLAETLERAKQSGYPEGHFHWPEKPDWLEVYYEIFGLVSVTTFHDDHLDHITNEAWTGGNVYLVDTRTYPQLKGLGYSEGLSYLYSSKLKDEVPYFNPILPYRIRRACLFEHTGIGSDPEALCRILGLLDR